MRKTKTMRAAALLLALTLITSCFVGGTFAKYVTSTTGNDSARVAYWGFDQVATTTIDLFATSYNNTQSEDSKGILAPGNSDSTTFAFGYTNYKTNEIVAPEVAYTFTVDVAVTGLEGETADTDALDANQNFTWTLQKGNEEATSYQTVAELIAAIEALAGENDGSKDYTAGQLPTAFTSADEVYTIGWNWAFYTSADADATDTAMGNAQDLDDLTLTITITAEQKD